jgi:hypothetical protein
MMKARSNHITPHWLEVGRNRLSVAPHFGEKYPETREALLEIKAKQQKKNLSE